MARISMKWCILVGLIIGVSIFTNPVQPIGNDNAFSGSVTISASTCAFDDTGKTVYWERFEETNGYWTLTGASKETRAGFGSTPTPEGETDVGDLGYGLVLEGNESACLNISTTAFEGLFMVDFVILDEDSDINITAMNSSNDELWYVNINPGSTTGFWDLEFDVMNGSGWQGVQTANNIGRVGFWFNLQVRFEDGTTSLVLDGTTGSTSLPSPIGYSNTITKLMITSQDSIQGDSAYFDNVIVGTITDPIDASGEENYALSDAIIIGYQTIDGEKTMVHVQGFSQVNLVNCMIIGQETSSPNLKYCVNVTDFGNLTVTGCYFRNALKELCVDGTGNSTDIVTIEGCTFATVLEWGSCIELIDCESVTLDTNEIINYHYWRDALGNDYSSLLFIYGINFYSIESATVSDNDLVNCGWYVKDDGTGNDVDYDTYYDVSGNTVNRKTLLFSAGINGSAIDTGDYGQIILVDCTGINIAGDGFASTANGRIYMNPLLLLYCSSCNISELSLYGIFFDGIYLEYCESILIEDCQITFAMRAAILIGGGESCTIRRNVINYGGRGFRIFMTDVDRDGAPTIIEYNTIICPPAYFDINSMGLDIQGANNLLIRGNHIETCGRGISIGEFYGNNPSKQIRVHDNHLEGLTGITSGSHCGLYISDGVFDLAFEDNEIMNFVTGISGSSQDDETLNLVPNIVNDNSVHNNSGSNSGDEAAGDSSVFKHTSLVEFDIGTPDDDYQVLVAFPSNYTYNKTESDGDDLRFYDISGSTLNSSNTPAELDYWIETWNETGESKVWVKVPDAGTRDIILKSGEPNATAASNGSNVFVLFDDFSHDELSDLDSQWNRNVMDYSTMSLTTRDSASVVHLQVGSSCNYGMSSFYGFHDGYIKTPGQAYGTIVTNGLYDYCGYYKSQASGTASTEEGPEKDVSLGHWSTSDFSRISSTSSKVSVLVDGDSPWSESFSSNIPAGSLPVNLMARGLIYGPGSHWGTWLESTSTFGLGYAVRIRCWNAYDRLNYPSTTNSVLDIDWISVRKCSNSEPVCVIVE